MKKIHQFSCPLILVLLLSACSGNDFPEKDTSIMPQNNGATESFSGNNNDQQPDSVVQVNSVTPISTPATIQPRAAQTAGLNPAHGEPGHRCDIAVGAPLNSPVQNTNPQPAPTIAAPVAPPVSSGSTAKLNPPHGEPGHDCSVAVGAPLNLP